MKRRHFLLTMGMAAASPAVGASPASAQKRANSIGHGFHATTKAKPGKGGELVELLFRAPVFDLPECQVFLIGRSKSDPDLVFVTEGWTSEEAHRRFFETKAAREFTARVMVLAEGGSRVDEVPIGGKVVLGVS